MSTQSLGNVVYAYLPGLLRMVALCLLGLQAQNVLCAEVSEATEPVRMLQPDMPVESSLTTTDRHFYSLDLKAGEYLLTIEQLGLDVSVHVLEPEYQLHNSPTFRDAYETVLLESSVPVHYVLRVDTDEYTAANGGYRLEVTQINDSAVIDAYRLMTDAAVAMNVEDDPDVELALDLYERAYAIWASQGNIAEQARSRLSAAWLLYWHALEWQRAADTAADAAFFYEQMGDAKLHANALHLRAAALIEVAGEAPAAPDSVHKETAEQVFASAHDLFTTAAEMQRQNEQWYDEAQTLNNIGLAYHMQARWPEAIHHYERAAEQFRRLDEWSSEMNPLANLAVIDQDSGRFVRAVATQERLLEIFPQDREAAWRADTLDNLAKANLVLGDADAALNNFLKALQIHEDILDRKGQGLSLGGIGSTYRMVGEIELAREFFERALPIREEANDGPGQMSVLRSLADIDLLEGNYDAALDNLDRASRFATSPLVVSGIDVMRAQAWIGNKEYARASQALDNARELATDIGATRDAADASYWTGQLSAAQSNHNDAKRWFAQARDLYASIDVRSGEAASLLGQARLSLTKGEIFEAIDFASAAIGKVEGLRSEVTNPELRAVYLGSRAEYYELLIEANMRAANNSTSVLDTERFLYAALEVSERAKARATVDLINEASVDLSSTMDPGIASRMASLNGQLAEKQYQRNLRLEQGAGEEEVRSIVSELLRIRAELDVLEADARNSHPLYASVRNPHVLSAPEIQGALGTDEVLLQFWLGEEASYAWIVTQRAIRRVPLPARETIEVLARRIHAGLAAGQSSTGQRQLDLLQLGEMVLAPATEQLLRASTVIIAADGALQYVPFRILSTHDPRVSLAEKRLISVPSMTAIVAQRKILEERVQPLKVIAIIGDPVFGPRDPRFPRDGISSRDVPGGMSGRREFSRLPFSGQEVEEIAALVDPGDRLLALGFDASTRTVEKRNLRDYRYIHLATHGIIDASQPALSSLVLSTHDAAGTPMNAFLRLRDIYAMDLNADLVVLSACETALGREIRGEGLMGLTQGFLYAGAKSVVASLWPVPDRATSELMALFYANLLSHEQSPADALRNAQADLAKSRRWGDPYYWGGFVLLGEWI